MEFSKARTLISKIEYFFSVLVLLFLFSCKDGIKFDPDFYTGDSKTGNLINENGDKINSWSEEYNFVACMTPKKVEELRLILLKAEISQEQKKWYDGIFQKLRRK